MSAIWHRGQSGWQLLAPSGFPDEAALHTLVEETPHLLPLAGAPRLIVLGREVQLGSNWADLVAIEPGGRVVIVEVKLAKNAEARRAIIAQILTYAAFLKGFDREAFESSLMASHLQKRGIASIQAAVSAADQDGSFDPSEFEVGLRTSLDTGKFRLVIVLDEAPAELVSLVGYLHSVASELTIDLVTVSSFDVNGEKVLVPQRVEPDREETARTPKASGPKPIGAIPSLGYEDFERSIEHAPLEQQLILRKLMNWAIKLESDGLAKLWTTTGISNRWTLVPRLPAIDSGLTTIWNENGAYISFYRSAMERHAPATLERMASSRPYVKIGQGNTTREIDEWLLDELRAAYEEARGQ